MIEVPVTLTSTGGAVSFASPVPLGYTKNKGVYRLLVTAEGEWEGLTIRCFWHLPSGTDPASSLVQDGAVDVPASVTAHPGNGCITFEGSDGVKTVTSADLRYRVGSNSGTEDGTMPEPGTPAWEQLVSETKSNADAAERAKNDAQAAAEGVKTVATKADEAAQKAEGAAQRAETAQKATEQAEAAAAESIAGAKKEALSAISTGEQGALGAVQQAQTTATGAVQAAQTAAESAVSAAKTNAVQEVEAAAKTAQIAAAKAEEAAERSTQAGIAASNAADDAAGSAVAAGNAASAAATSEGNAAASAKKAQDVADSLPADYVAAVNEIAALKTNKADKLDLEAVQKQIGNLDDLTTKAKETLVAAINEAARTGSGGAGSITMRTDGGYIQYSTDDGSTWENLIALDELKGEPGKNGADGSPGQNGADGAPGADGYSPAASVEQSADGAKITITDKSGTTEAVVKNGKDGANGRDGADGQPGRDGTDGAPGRDGVDGQPGKDGKDGITPTIGDNGNWYLGGTDTGKPSRGADGATGATGATGEKGTDGKSAYQYAVEGGYTGTEEEFAEKLAQEMPGALPNPNALTFMGAATGTYDGSAPLTVNIPAGGGGTGSGSSDTWELINTITVGDDAPTSVTFSADSNGNDFALKKFYLITTTAPRNTYFTARINNKHWTEQFSAGNLSAANVAANKPIRIIFQIVDNGFYKLECANNNTIFFIRDGERNLNGGVQSHLDSVSSVSFVWGAASAYAEGDVFTLYGVRT